MTTMLSLVHLDNDSLFEIATWLIPKDYLAFRRTCRCLFRALGEPYRLRRYEQLHTVVNVGWCCIMHGERHGIITRFHIYKHLDDGGCQYWFRHDKIHRGNGLPAVITLNGTKSWYNDGQAVIDEHSGMPRVEYRDGVKQIIGGVTCVYHNGRLHSVNDEPAMEVNGLREWYFHGMRHRGDDKPAVMFSNGTCEWRMFDKLHRLGGPAVVRVDGTVEWWRNGRRESN